MAGTGDYSSILIPSVPSLSHIALVKVALRLLSDFDMETLNKVFSEIQPGYKAGLYEGCKQSFAQLNQKLNDAEMGFTMEEMSMLIRGSKFLHFTDSDAVIQKDCESNYKRAREIILRIPKLLRCRLLEAVIGMYYSLQRWQYDHLDILKTKVNAGLLYWRSDGTIDRIQTAKHSFDAFPELKFLFACKYCLVETVQNWWTECGLLGLRCLSFPAIEQYFESFNDPLVYFWVRWLLEGYSLPWTQSIPDYIDLIKINRTLEAHFGTFFPLLQPKDREKIFASLQCASLFDIRQCMRILPKGQVEQLLPDLVKYILKLHLEWPMQRYFLETADKLWSYMNEHTFSDLLLLIVEFQNSRKDFDYYEVLDGFWNNSPDNLKAYVKSDEDLVQIIDSGLNKRNHWC